MHYLHTYAAYLPKRFDDRNFAFYGTVLAGNTQQLDRKTRGIHLLDGSAGRSAGQALCRALLPAGIKSQGGTLVSNLLKAYQADIKTLTWMSPATSEKALEKIGEFTPKIGYPTHWRDYSAYEVERSDLIGDVQRGNMFEWNRKLNRINQPVDKTEWGMTPPTINAYYNPAFNEIVFPAAILQPPFFDPNADDAVNYGGIGAVIGHEISHGFDDQGSKYDGKGVFNDWWTKEDRANFDAKTAALVKQYDCYEPLPGLHVIGKNTLGENIADNAGIAIALKAYHISLNGKPAPVIERSIPATSASICPSARSGAPSSATAPCAPRRCRMSTARRNSASSAPPATRTNGMTPSTSSRATNIICRPTNAFTSGSAQGAAADLRISPAKIS